MILFFVKEKYQNRVPVAIKHNCIILKMDMVRQRGPSNYRAMGRGMMFTSTVARLMVFILGKWAVNLQFTKCSNEAYVGIRYALRRQITHSRLGNKFSELK